MADSATQITYLLVGSGRLAFHMGRYFESIGLAHNRWNRHESIEQLDQRLRDATHIWLLISDDQIEPFIHTHTKRFGARKLLHASGALVLTQAESAHPLASFTKEPFDIDFYKRIPFVTEKGCTPFQKLFPKLTNPHAEIDPSRKALYHALCVVAGPFTSQLWSETAARFKSQFGLDPSLLSPYMESMSRNIQFDPANSLTGPLARGDLKTIEKNLEALKGDPLELIYRAFLKLKG